MLDNPNATVQIPRRMNPQPLKHRFLLLAALVCASALVVACGSLDTGQTDAPIADPADQPGASAPADPPAPSPDAEPARDPWNEDSDAFDATSIMEGGKRYEITSVLPKDAIPAVFDPDFLPADDADRQYRDTDLVIGVSIDGDHRAYHVPYLSGREIVNDVVGGKPIAVTW